MWKLKTKAIPVVIRALVMIKKDTQNFIDQIAGKPFLQEKQKIAFRSTAHMSILKSALKESRDAAISKSITPSKYFSHQIGSHGTLHLPVGSGKRLGRCCIKPAFRRATNNSNINNKNNNNNNNDSNNNSNNNSKIMI